MSSHFEATRVETVWEGALFAVRRGTYRHEDGEEVEREWVAHPGAVGVVAHDGERVWLVRQPREAVGEPDLLELPAGKVDVEGEDALGAARRELAEEIGKAAEHWERLHAFYSSPGFADEELELWLATGLSDVPEERESDERIEVVSHPLAELDALIAQVHDAKTLIGLLALRARL